MTRRSFVGPLLLVASCASTEPGSLPAGEERVVAAASLGASTRAPSKAEVASLGLDFDVRARGQVVTEVENGGAAARAGVQPGDALVKLGAVELFSRDDIDDVLRVSEPGQRLEVVVVRGRTTKQETVAVSLGSGRAHAPEGSALAWQFASLAQLGDALALAKKEGKRVLVGLSGAET